MFLWLGNLVAWISLILGVGRAGVGFYVGSLDQGSERTAAAARYLGSASSGQAVQEGIFLFGFGVVLGVLVRIGRSRAQRP